jgi:hypothetical protein
MKWKLTQAVTGEPEIDEWQTEDDEDLSLGYSLMRALAESDHTLVEIYPGVWRQSSPDVGNSGPGW